ncbi:predicted protein [Lichtheimia corymbifera JMRC:FSU:9682]|uniref:Uncharacterized protein n=1 Tax=Lichtheimia corymbifera JMRC:FSU:9682 TaxID=1263082 RepID=A0A068SGR4_9FUNG|nr:predicted protein [Lichtheimia corymbifera JMRC:FSU:9682]
MGKVFAPMSQVTCSNLLQYIRVPVDGMPYQLSSSLQCKQSALVELRWKTKNAIDQHLDGNGLHSSNTLGIAVVMDGWVESSAVMRYPECCFGYLAHRQREQWIVSRGYG